MGEPGRGGSKRRRVARIEAQIIVWVGIVFGALFLVVLVLRLVGAV